MKLLLLASGSGTLAQAIIDARIENKLGEVEITAIVSDRTEAEVLHRAKLAKIPSQAIPFKTPRTLWDQELLSRVTEISPDLVASVGFMRILGADFVKRFKVINSHPSLLPNFPGAHAVRDALKAGVSTTGCTVHWVDQGLDSGPIIRQMEVEVLPGDNEATLHERIKIVERKLIVDVIRELGAKL